MGCSRLCVSLSRMEQKTSQSAVVDDVSLFLGVCVSDRGNIVVESRWWDSRTIKRKLSCVDIKCHDVVCVCVCGG